MADNYTFSLWYCLYPISWMLPVREVGYLLPQKPLPVREDTLLLSHPYFYPKSGTQCR